MSYLVFWGVILSDERSEESRTPLPASNLKLVACATRPHCDFLQL